LAVGGRSVGGAERANCRERTATRVKEPSIGKLGAMGTSSGLYTRVRVGCLGLGNHTSRSALLSLQRRKSPSQIPDCRHEVDLHAAKTGTFAWRARHLAPGDLGRASRSANDRAQNRNVRDPLADCCSTPLCGVLQLSATSAWNSTLPLPQSHALRPTRIRRSNGASSSDSSPTEISLPTDARRDHCRFPGQQMQTRVRQRDTTPLSACDGTTSSACGLDST
jgi:hypothetical protein